MGSNPWRLSNTPQTAKHPPPRAPNPPKSRDQQQRCHFQALGAVPNECTTQDQKVPFRTVRVDPACRFLERK